ncbi:MAG: gas vesicle protein GvpJ, partial [Rhizobiaceae bacterium]
AMWQVTAARAVINAHMPPTWQPPEGNLIMSQLQNPLRSDGLADILERVLDKGIVIAGDVSISLVGIELLNIRLRLIIASVDKAKEMGINWWEHDPTLTNSARHDANLLTAAEEENRRLRGRLAILEKRVADLNAA